jgi:hypothetical protein
MRVLALIFNLALLGALLALSAWAPKLSDFHVRIIAGGTP